MPDSSDSPKPRANTAASPVSSSGSAAAGPACSDGCADPCIDELNTSENGASLDEDPLQPAVTGDANEPSDTRGAACNDTAAPDVLADTRDLLNVARDQGVSQDVCDAAMAAAAKAASKAAKTAAARALEKAKAHDGIPHYTVGEEIFNSVTHGVGVLLGIAALVLLIVKAAVAPAHPASMAAGIVYGITIILEYLFSTLYHAIPARGAKLVFRVFDHSGIYLLIAGSYTPFLLVTLADCGGFPMFVAIWALAIAGILFELIGRERQPKWVTILIYLIMGWLVVFRLPQLLHALNPIGIGLLLAGGLCYTAGTAFYVAKRIRYMHSVWHLWVLAGSVLQFMAVILFVI